MKVVLLVIVITLVVITDIQTTSAQSLPDSISIVFSATIKSLILQTETQPFLSRLGILSRNRQISLVQRNESDLAPNAKHFIALVGDTTVFRILYHDKSLMFIDVQTKETFESPASSLKKGQQARVIWFSEE